MAGLDPAIQGYKLKPSNFRLWMAGSEAGHGEQ
jgi:hypothetical protein